MSDNKSKKIDINNKIDAVGLDKAEKAFDQKANV